MNCTFTRCTRQVLARGLCNRHYRQYRKGKLGTTEEHEWHGKWKTPEYDIWKQMKQRCFNPNSQSYRNYGARGITVCERWRSSFQAFYDDMGPRPSSDYSIERINNDGNYEPSNCKWGTRSEQNINHRTWKNAASGERNIYWNKQDGKWRVRVIRDYKEMHVGMFNNVADAIKARDEFLIRYNQEHGNREFRRTAA
jgi:hypothetical protein